MQNFLRKLRFCGGNWHIIKLWWRKKMSGDPSLKEPVIFYSEELTNTKIVLLSLKGIKLDYVEDEEE